MDIRNIAIIAHVDHGKTTLTDAIMAECGHGDEGTMDSNALEQERGITIYAKNTSVIYKGTKINIVDTPGHADFGSEVERVLRSIDTVLLVVDAQEGPMPQTRFVLKKSLELGIRPILVLNKIDKPAANPARAHDEVLELFMELGANDKQLDFLTVYAVGRQGIAKKNLTDEAKDLTPLLDMILEHVPPANAKKNANDILTAQVFNLGYDNFLGRLAVCRIYSGTINENQNVWVKDINGKTFTGKITKLFTFDGKKRIEVRQAESGDIITIAGIPDIYIGETITDNENSEALPAINVDEPTISLQFLVNNSPFAGREGTFVTGRQIRERLERELETNVGLKVDFSANEYFTVFGRGELHIAILIENMRREGYELQVSQPKVIFKEIDGEQTEPFEELIIDCPTVYSGAIIETLGKRKGVMTNMTTHGNQVRLVFEIPTRGLLGYKNAFIIDTKGEGIMSSRVIGFKPYAGEIEKRETGSMTSMISGKSLGFSLWNLQDRGRLFIGPAVEVYEGMVVGDTSKGDDMDVNPCKGKAMSNMRSSGKDEALMLVPPFELSIERGLELMREDEYLEVTPKNVRLRKKFLTELDRARSRRKDL
ncbi:MAG: GTP-binding protein TypA [Candidatus Taylorbacteria bacterium RIFCSPHIGHO2_02_FULL_45_28]|uniref:50S ribosomal subunit assembly factor BipA n=1 Tax=Candidatus Taylorbacteria bacterium RIFCSPHIGHO2_12_FULL_45_16 TaxID=1802315 RepID=A0A1G2MZK0_9BACT|nr:MAG: GTP-binding protein TypA [Candidatus Taylorbacteria bacterium RIFCSPHIGHO2_01_FULL_44_110]OHA25598.1 MAG: GTP-binding protein TypA [Candidatus Taylorbacteria bacterium RIFCSPHIGHO2_02_FULL_45_28]OHA29264.1 MAG: GTP-binding protein TypA [Candidatus Taylorbacteria bacterium RIFCSPHIGHO2_12_FULL_45_16]OHA33486.1 MAG: GTP-binding protein TypA [Candidatus Taylorbacteria bacterium RIFCSPLOWO2_01_FULL_45_59]OHA39185.1 MAG: GTP-binding protein TypA [Candidatus Taylorbacteria bacterium RIFCSPLOW